MYVLGSMLRLPVTDLRVPVPWWHRAVLGFEHDTQVFAAITEPTSNRPGELLVSVLDLNRWPQHTVLRYEAQDAPGVVEKVIGDVHYWNIALAETATVEGGRSHHVDLLCETYHGAHSDADLEIGKVIEGGSARISDKRSLGKFPVPLVWSRLGTIEHGWVRFHAHGEAPGWRETFEAQLSAMNRLTEFDLQKVVLSVDTEARLFRALIPRTGAVLVSIEHADEPGVLSQLAGKLRSAKVNILSSLLKRGGAAPRNAIFVAVCEPEEPTDTGELAAAIRHELVGLPHSLRVDPRINETGLSPGQVVYSRHPEDIVAHVPSQLRARVQELRAGIPRKTRLVFLSRRFLGGRAEHYAKKVRDVLKDSGCKVIEATPLAGGTRTSLDEVSAAMWASKAGVVLGVEPEHETDVSFSLNLAHEFGFMQGQGKPLLLLVEAQSRVEKELDAWSNLKGITAPRFSRKYALADDHQESISSVVRRWLTDLEVLS